MRYPMKFLKFICIIKKVSDLSDLLCTDLVLEWLTITVKYTPGLSVRIHAVWEAAVSDLSLCRIICHAMNFLGY